MRIYPIIFFILFFSNLSGQSLLKTTGAEIAFVSDAPLELIKASSSSCQGLLDLNTREFAFKVIIKTFDGFNNRLQREHFMENYMEIGSFPDATFTGRIIEALYLDDQLKAEVKAKGFFNIHGAKKEQILKITLDQKEEVIFFDTKFIIDLDDHHINIPQIVKYKIAEHITVSVNGVLTE